MLRCEPIPIFLSRGSNRVALAGLAAALLLGGARPGWMVAGFGVFLALEYVIHRFVLHAPLAPVRMVAEWQSRIHYGHHEEPDNLDLVFLPAPVIAVLAYLFARLYFLLSGDLAVAAALTAGNLAGLLYYEWVHMVAHLPVTPMTAWGRWIKKLHLLHHHKNEHYWLGVTNPLGDVLFGTFGAASDIPTTGTARTRPDPGGRRP